MIKGREKGHPYILNNKTIYIESKFHPFDNGNTNKGIILDAPGQIKKKEG